MNHKDKRTAYPPLVQLLFALIAQIAYAPGFLKLVILFADCSILAGIVAILVQRGQSAAWAGFYAFSPLSLIAYAGEAHFDALSTCHTGCLGMGSPTAAPCSLSHLPSDWD